MKRVIYENFLLAKYLFLTMEEINNLEAHIKSYYVDEIERYLKEGELWQ